MANVLIVDDDSDTVEVSTELLESSGHRVQTGYNGKEGLKSLGEGKLPDCVLLDVDMPVLNGPGMAHEMLLHDAGEEKIPIVLVSARADLAEIAARMGTPYFLAKASADYGRRSAQTTCSRTTRATSAGIGLEDYERPISRAKAPRPRSPGGDVRA